MNHSQLFTRVWIAVVFVVALIAAHAFVLYHTVSRMAWIAAVGLVILLLLAHFGILGSIYVFFRRRVRH